MRDKILHCTDRDENTKFIVYLNEILTDFTEVEFANNDKLVYELV